eukprot:NODE_2167_length_1665_cov_42.487678_g1854_i0.p1 GENE.NODE_2167_length_1665_cov_42.487678_g1854_i0~~NODE_2167_length_1665_cov_42.487678_g1854_i0.p1  ORF type:complete len:537 (+),score=77.81 NODE_2167_length_1665_cov_42.487678_g1854_i0:109-1611(+)
MMLAQDDFSVLRETFVWDSSAVDVCPDPLGCHSICKGPMIRRNNTSVAGNNTESNVTIDDIAKYICGFYYSCIVIFALHSPIERLLCNEYIVWMNNGMDPATAVAVRDAWTMTPTCGTILIGMFNNKKFGQTPLIYLMKRINYFLGIIFLSLVSGRLLSYLTSFATPVSWTERWKTRIPPKELMAQNIVLSVLLDVGFLVFYYLSLLKYEELQNRMEITDIDETDDDNKNEDNLNTQESKDNEDVETEKVCRICHDSGDSPLIKPCKCKGSMAFVHHHCISTWREYSSWRAGCATCKTCYKFRKAPMTLTGMIEGWTHPMSAVLKLVYHTLITLITTASIYTQGMLLYILLPGEMSICLLCSEDWDVGENKVQFEIGHFAASGKLHMKGNYIFLYGVSYFVPMLLIWLSNSVFMQRRYGRRHEPNHLWNLLLVASLHFAFIQIVSRWQAISSRFTFLPSLQYSVGLFGVIGIGYLFFLCLLIIYNISVYLYYLLKRDTET